MELIGVSGIAVSEKKGFLKRHVTKKLHVSKSLHSVGFEPTSTNTFELESNPLDRSGKNAVSIAHLGFDPRTFGL